MLWNTNLEICEGLMSHPKQVLQEENSAVCKVLHAQENVSISRKQKQKHDIKKKKNPTVRKSRELLQSNDNKGRM